MAWNSSTALSWASASALGRVACEVTALQAMQFLGPE